MTLALVLLVALAAAAALFVAVSVWLFGRGPGPSSGHAVVKRCGTCAAFGYVETSEWDPRRKQLVHTRKTCPACHGKGRLTPSA